MAEQWLHDMVSSIPIVDTHTHLRPWGDAPQPFTLYDLLNQSGCIRATWEAAGALTKQESRQGREFGDWASLSNAIGQIETTAFYRILLHGLKSLYGVEFDELNEDVVESLGRRMAEAYRDPEWYATVLRDRAGVELVCEDSRTPVDLSLFPEGFVRTARMDNYVWFADPTWGRKVIDRHGEERTSSLDGLIECMRRDFEEAAESGAVAIKSNDSWGRTLNYETVDKQDAVQALSECAADPTNKAAAKRLGDFMMNQVAVYCAEFGFPLQIHTGPAMGTLHMVEYGNPLNLNSLFLRNPDTRFVILHAGGPFVNVCCHLAVQFPNVYLDLCGVFGRDWVRTILEQWIEFVPAGKLMWGSDMHSVEEMYAMSLSFRETLAQFLGDRIKSGYLTTATAERFAWGILGENARRVLRL